MPRLELPMYGLSGSTFRSMENVAEPKSPIQKNPERKNTLKTEILEGVGFNATLVRLPNGTRFYIGRNPLNILPPNGLPDYNSLIASRVEGQSSIVVSKQIWSPRQSPGGSLGDNFEDFRASPNPDGLCGLTVVRKSKGLDGKFTYTPYPAIIRFNTFGEMPETTVLESLGPGKNMTPIGRIYDGKETFLFRPDNKEYDHKLQVVTYDEKSKEAKAVHDLEFHSTDWSKWRMGTAAGLFWLDEKKEQAILPIHGITITSTEDTSVTDRRMFNYSLGVALLGRDENGRLKVERVASEPLIVPGQLGDLGIDERFNFRRIVYACGVNENESGGYTFTVNKGDKGTVLVKLPENQVLGSLGLPPAESSPVRVAA